MSLVGNLADLGLEDIFQIVSLSRRSGTLQLDSPLESGEIVFVLGKVVAVARSKPPLTAGDVLLQSGVISSVTYDAMLAEEASGMGAPELFKHFSVDHDALERAFESLLMRTIFEMFAWDEGTFSFVLAHDPPLRSGLWSGFSLTGSRVVLARGLNPQYLAIEGARVRDESARPTSNAPVAARAPDVVHPARVVPAPVTTRQWHLVVLDDDILVAKLIADALAARFSDVHVATKVSDALELLAKLHGESVVLAIDLIVPRSDGRGILGGIEILEKMREQPTYVPVVVFSDYRNEEAEKRAQALGAIALIAKPRKADVFAGAASHALSEQMRDFVSTLGEALTTYAHVPDEVSSTSKTAEPGPDALDMSLPDGGFGATVDASVAALVEDAERDLGSRPAHGELQNLRSMLSELNDPANRDTITLLVLRFASNVVERAGLFLATRRAFIGLGGFSGVEGSDAFVAKVRRIQIPVDHESVFATVVHYRAAVVGPLLPTDANKRLVQGLGGEFHERPTLAVPIISGDRVAAILFGDNPSGKPLGATEGLEIFLQQAGLAMDRALLERRLEERKKRE